MRPAREPELEEAEQAVIEGDVAYTPGTARAALAHHEFRRVWTGSLASNVGTWMQNVALGAFGYAITHSALYVALLGFAQLGPLLLLSVFSGALADYVDRKVLLIVAQAEQLVMSLGLAWAARGPHPSTTTIFAFVLAIGVGNALNGPVYSATLPILVGRRDLPGAVSLQSVQLNLSRVVGPAVGGLLLPAIGASWVFVLNAASYLLAIGAILSVSIPRPYPEVGERGIRRIAHGFVVARGDRLVGQVLVTMTVFSLFSLPFVGLMPVLAGDRFGINPTGLSYGLLYATFGLGAALGAVSVGTVFVARSKSRLAGMGMALFALFLGVFSLLRWPTPSFPVAFLVGFFYFTTVTSLATLLQENLADTVRGRVMALWAMAFGGTVPVGILAAGALAHHSSISAVVLGGAIFAAALAVFTLLLPPDRGPRPARCGP